MASILTDSNLSLALSNTHETSTVKSDVGANSGICTRIQKDKNYRKNIINTLCLYASFLALSFAKGQIGPSFLDLQAISGVGLEGGSAILMAMNIGYMIGAILGGILFDKFHRALILAFAKFFLACAVIAVPWCSIYGLMVFTFFALGVMLGVTDAVSNVQIQFIWGKEGRQFMQALHFMYSFGLSISPMVTAAFLENPKETNVENLTTTGNERQAKLQNISHNRNISLHFPPNESIYNNTMYNHDVQEFKRSPDLYIAYIIMGCVIFIVCVFQFSFYFHYDFKRRQNTKTTEKNRERKQDEVKSRLSLFTKFQAILHMAGILALVCGIDDTLLSFLSTFCVQHLSWTKTQGSFLTSLTCFVVVVGRFIGIFLVKVLSPVKIIGIHCVLTMLVFIGIYVCVLYHSTLGMWIIVPIFGYGKAPIFACIFSWTDEVFMTVTGKITSMIFVIITSSQAVNPLILGFLMEKYSRLWFCYLFLGESVVLVLLFVSALMLSNRVQRMHGTNYQEENMEVKAAQELLENPQEREKPDE